MRKIIPSLIMTVFMSACSSSYYGYDKATWDSMSKEEQEKTISDVNRLLKHGNEMKSQNAETQSIINRAGTYGR